MFHVKHPTLTRRDVSRETLARLETYASMLLRWNPTINLVSSRDTTQLWTRHIEDSLELAPLIPLDAAFAVDLGSGGGLPGIVLAIATRVQFHLVEADQRKAAFLREAARATQCPVVIHATRIETCGIAEAPVITARALAPLPVLLERAAPLLSPDGVCLFPKGRGYAGELTAAASRWQMHVETLPRRSEPDAAILRIREIKRVQHDA